MSDMSKKQINDMVLSMVAKCPHCKEYDDDGNSWIVFSPDAAKLHMQIFMEAQKS